MCDIIVPLQRAPEAQCWMQAISIIRFFEIMLFRQVLL